MRNILNYETKNEFLADGNIFPDTYWLRKDASYKENYIPTREDSSQKYGPFNSKGMVSSVSPGVAYIQECGMTIYNNTKFPYINLDEKLGGDYGATKNFTWAELGITQDVYQAYKDEINNNNPLWALNIFFRGNYCESIYYVKYYVNDTPELLRIYFNGGGWVLDVYANGTAIFHINAE